MKGSTAILLGLGVFGVAGLVGAVLYLRNKGTASNNLLEAVAQTRERFFRLAERTEQYQDLFDRLDHVITPFEMRVEASPAHYTALTNAELDELIAIEAEVARRERTLAAN